jgi:hypothetical protein
MEAKATRSCIGIIIHSPFVDKIIIGSCFILTLVLWELEFFFINNIFYKVRNKNKKEYIIVTKFFFALFEKYWQ